MSMNMYKNLYVWFLYEELCVFNIYFISKIWKYSVNTTAHT